MIGVIERCNYGANYLKICTKFVPQMYKIAPNNPE